MWKIERLQPNKLKKELIVIDEMIASIEYKKKQCNADRQTAKILALSSINVDKQEFLSCEDALSERQLLEKVATIKKFEYSPLGKALEKQIEVNKTKKGKRNKLFKAAFGTDEKYGNKLTSAWLSLLKEQV